MSNTNEFNEIKSGLTTLLESYNLTTTQINEMLSDDFINGVLELQQQEPENDEFLAKVRNFSNEESLASTLELQESLKSELNKDCYLTKLIQYVIDAWRDIDLSGQIITMTLSEESDITSDDVKKIKYGTSSAMWLAGIPSPVRVIASELLTYTQLAVATYEQDQKFYKIAEKFDDALRNIVRGAQGRTGTAKSHPSPLVLDLDGDGVETDKQDSSVHFDHDNNGFAESTGWVGKDDGLLVRDINGNGQIDNGTELFGNNSVLSSGQKAANGFEALKDLDSNHDGVFNNLDTAWSQVKVWKDANQDGLVNNSELLSLEQAGVSGINLDYENTNITDSNGNQHNQAGTFIKTD